MSSNQASILKIKNNMGSYTPLYPTLPKSQVIGWNAGEIFGPYILELKVTDWLNNTQMLPLDGISDQNIPQCVKVLEGTEEQMIAQKESYKKLKSRGGIQSLNNKIMFICDETPKVNFKVQVWWTL